MNQPTKILIVEDEGIIGLSLRMELETAGYTVCNVVATGADAVDSAKKHQPGLVLMDIHLAGEMDGMEAARRIRAAPDTRHIPIVFMTGYADQDLMRRARQIIPLAYVVKPVAIEQIKKLACQPKNPPKPS